MTGAPLGDRLPGRLVEHPDHRPLSPGASGPAFLNPVEPVAEPAGNGRAGCISGVAVDLDPLHAAQAQGDGRQGGARRGHVAAAGLPGRDPVTELDAALASPAVQRDFPDQRAGLGGQDRVGVAEARLPPVVGLSDPGELGAPLSRRWRRPRHPRPQRVEARPDCGRDRAGVAGAHPPHHDGACLDALGRLVSR